MSRSKRTPSMPETKNNPPEHGRFSSRWKMDAGLHSLRGEDLDTLSQKLGVTAVTLSHWPDQLLATGRAGLQSRPADERDGGILRLPRRSGRSRWPTNYWWSAAGPRGRTVLWRAGGGTDEPDEFPLHAAVVWSGPGVSRVGDAAVHGVRGAGTPLTRGGPVPAPRPEAGLERPRPADADPRGAGGRGLCGQGASQSLGAPALSRRTDLEGEGAAPDARRAAARPHAPGARVWARGPRRHGSYRPPRCDVGHRRDPVSEPPRGDGDDLHRDRSLYG